MGTFNTIPHFKFWCQKVLPLVYDDSLSYYEVLCKVIYYLNKMIEDINNIPAYINELINDDKLKDIMSELLDELREQIARANEGENTTASYDRIKGELVWLNGQLVIMTRDILAGDRYVEDTGAVGVTGNYKHTSIEECMNNIDNKIGTLSLLNTSNKTNIVYAINSLIDDIDTLIGDIENLETPVKTNIVASINSLKSYFDTIIGDLSDLETLETSSLVAAINSVENKIGDLTDLGESFTHKNNVVAALNDLQPIVLGNVTGDGVKTYGELLNELYGEVQSIVNDMYWLNKRKLKIDTRFGCWDINAIGTSVLEFYGVHNVLDNASRRTEFAVKLAANDSRLIRIVTDFTQTPSVTTSEGWSNTVAYLNSDFFRILYV